MSLSRTWARRRGDTSRKRIESKIDHRVNQYQVTVKGRVALLARRIYGR